MQATFLLGPAGSGKTCRCLEEIRAALAESPDGAPLVFLAPKQATFQLERQLLSDPALPGYTRLHILSFERLAEFMLERLAGPRPSLLNEEGRVMVLRALLGRRHHQLRVFRATARLPGFARQLSLLLRELQRHGWTPARLETLAARPDLAPRLADKLHDLAQVLRAYRDWLQAQQLQDADHLLDLATEALRSESQEPKSELAIGGLWLDGFAEMTPQEVALVSALSPFCARGLLAFCLEDVPGSEPSWLSPWTVVGATFHRCHAALAALPANRVIVEVLKRRRGRNRFSANPELAHLEQHWSNPNPYAAPTPLPTGREPAGDGATPTGRASAPTSVRLAACPTPEAEAAFAAREILRFVREPRGRFRDCAVLVRSLDGWHATLRSVFTRYGLPFFLDRREPVTHHPLAELTRYAVRTVALGWRPDDWFGALKTGLVRARDTEIDRLENEALAHGWEGKTWREPLPPDASGVGHPLEGLRERLVPPFARMAAVLETAGFQPTGSQLAGALRALWDELGVAEELGRWSSAPCSNGPPPISRSIHLTVWEQTNEWLENLERAFAGESMPIRDWLAIMEAGLSGLTVGVIPPALDQVLIGAIDRSRNPDLRRVFVLGLNETLFPAPPPHPVLLTEGERSQLSLAGHPLGVTRPQQLGHERYLGYIAATRTREQVTFTFARRDAKGAPLNPSVFVAHLERLYPGLRAEDVTVPPPLADSQHACELAAPLIQAQAAAPAQQSPSATRASASRGLGGNALPGARPDPCRHPPDAPWAALAVQPVFQTLLAKAAALAAARDAGLSPAAAEKLYTPELAVSINALEDFAECPFKFLVGRGLGAQERFLFEPDVRERGSFQHEILKEFHRLLQSHGQRWRDVMAPEALVRIRQVGESVVPVFRNGLFAASAWRRFQAEVLIGELERLVGTVIEWMREQYEFDPAVVEVSFGMNEPGLPGWRVPLDHGHALTLRGRIDRIDLLHPPDDDAALAVVIDYKSSEHTLENTRLHHGLELQLLGYLNTLCRLANPPEHFGVGRIIPAGVFYVNLKGSFRSGHSRTEVLAENAESLAKAYQHLGRFNGEYLNHLDNTGRDRGDQFRYRKNKDGGFSKTGNDAMTGPAFTDLLGQAAEHIRRIGTEIYAGTSRVDPFRIGTQTACDHCDYRSVCRFDPWVQPYRTLRPPPKPKENPPAKPVRRRRRPT